jgi:hypothetical protein
MNWKGYEWKQLKYYPDINMEGLRKPRKKHQSDDFPTKVEAELVPAAATAAKSIRTIPTCRPFSMLSILKYL